MPSKLSKLLSEKGVEYRWILSWPPIPVRRGANDFPVSRVQREVRLQVSKGHGKWEEKIQIIPPDEPEWVAAICMLVFDEALPVNKNTTIEFLDAAIFGYCFATHERLQADLPARLSGIQKAFKKQSQGYMRQCRSRIKDVVSKWSAKDVAEYLHGFAYGIERQHRREGWKFVADTEILKIYQTLLNYQDDIENLIRKNATAKKITEFLVPKFPHDYSKNMLDSFAKNPENEVVFINRIQKMCQRVGIALPRAGRPTSK